MKSQNGRSPSRNAETLKRQKRLVRQVAITPPACQLMTFNMDHDGSHLLPILGSANNFPHAILNINLKRQCALAVYVKFTFYGHSPAFLWL